MDMQKEGMSRLVYHTLTISRIFKPKRGDHDVLGGSRLGTESWRISMREQFELNRINIQVKYIFERIQARSAYEYMNPPY